MRKSRKSIRCAAIHAGPLEARRLFSGYGLTHVANFDSGNSGDQPVTTLFDSSGNLFGITIYGGAFGYGNVFELPSGASTISVVASFNLTDGANPSNLVIDSSGNLFGTTTIGGATNNGTIFKIAKGTNTITTLASLDGANSGSSPLGICVDGQGNIFGTALAGGAGNDGTFFEIPAGSTTLQVIHSFAGAEGIQPDFVIADTNGTIYGACATDSGFGYGTVFKYTGAAFSPMFDLARSGGRYGSKKPIALGLDSSHNLFILSAGVPNSGSQGSIIVSLAASSGTPVSWGDFWGFNGFTSSAPTSFHVDAVGNIWGTTTSTSTTGRPIIFRELRSELDPVIVTTIPAANGNYPAGVSIGPDGNVYGVLTNGPINTGGAIFKDDLSTSTPTLSTIATLQPPGGYRASGDVLTHDAAGDVFGTTIFYNGTNTSEALYEIPAGSSAPVTLTTIPDPSLLGVPSLISDDAGDLFTVTNPGASGSGQIMELVAGSNTLQLLATLPAGAHPTALTRDAAGNLFGAMLTSSTTRSLFELPVGQNAIVTLTTFAGAFSTSPEKLVVDSDGNLFGCGVIDSSTTASTIYELSAGASAINVLTSFTDFGNVPTSLALDSTGNLFGTIGYARYNNAGSVFEIARGSSTLSTISSFAANTGAPVALQVDAFGNLFGAATYGGPDQKGSIFEIAAGSATIQTLFNFSAISAYYPGGVTLLANGTLYATYLTKPGTLYGGVFAISPMSNSINGSSAITLRRDPDQNRIDWSSNAAVGQVDINDPAGLTIFGNDSRDVITLDYSRGNPLPQTLHLNGRFIINGLASIDDLGGKSLDIGTSDIYVSYCGMASDPIGQIRAALQMGYNGGDWTGSTGIRSQAAANDGQKISGIGYVDSGSGLIANQPANTIELKYVLFGDTGLLGAAGSVSFTDFMRMTQNYTSTNATWQQGDFNYDGTVDASDFALLKPNYGQTLVLPPPPLPPAPAPIMTPGISPTAPEKKVKTKMPAVTVTPAKKAVVRAEKQKRKSR